MDTSDIVVFYNLYLFRRIITPCLAPCDGERAYHVWRGRVSSGVVSLFPYTTLLLVVYKAQIPYQLADISVVDDEACQDIADGCSHQ